MSREKLILTISFAVIFFTACMPAPPEATPIPVPLPVTVQQNVKYLTAIDPEASDQLVDIYWPEGNGLWPVVVYAHGSTESKDNELSKKFGRTIAEQGFVVFVIDYDPKLPEVMVIKNGRAFRELAESAGCAVLFAREKGPEFNGDPKHIIWVGFSAGGYTGVMASISDPNQFEIWDGFANKRGSPRQQVECAAKGSSDQVNDLVMASGLFYLPENLNEIDAELGEILNKIYKPGANSKLRVRMIHGEQDNVVRFSEADALYTTLNEAGYDVELTPTVGGHSLYLEQVTEILNVLRK